MNLRGHAALITGGTQGVGAAIAKRLAKAGANLVIHGLREDDNSLETMKACQSFGVKVHAIYSDLYLPMEEVLQNVAKSALAHDAALCQPLDRARNPRTSVVHWIDQRSPGGE